MEMNQPKKNGKQKGKTVDLSNLIYGRVPPQNLEMEAAVLGAVMLEKNAFSKVSKFLRAECFYTEKNQIIFRAFQDLALRSEPIDTLTVSELLHKKGLLDIVGGAFEITELTRGVQSSAHIENHARTIFQKFIQREVISISAKSIEEAYEEKIEVPDLLDEMQTNLFRLTRGLYKKEFVEMELSAMKAIDEIEKKLNKQPGELTGVPSSFKEIDNCTGGWQETDFIILAARPSVGKTALALNMAKNAATHSVQPVGVAFFSLEMSNSQLVQRIISAESEVLLEKIRDGDLNEIEKKAVYAAADRVSNYPIYIDDSASLNIFELKAKVKRLIEQLERENSKGKRKLKKSIGLIIIDYLQLMSGVNNGLNQNKNDIVAEISRELKIFAKELEIPIMALSQMSRAVETRADKEPQLSDLRESGAIEQDADLIMFLFRDLAQITLKIAKHRNGKRKKLKLDSKLEIQKFLEPGSEPYNPRKYEKASNVGSFDEGLPEAENELSFINQK
jgi:replicative DNA helicase